MKIRIGGVPEHFNLPWHLLLESGYLKSKNIEADWLDFKGGTGAMIEALNNGEVDIAMLLTEGAVVGIDKGGSYQIVSFYVASPLIWGIHVSAHSNLYSMSDIKGKKYAISRYGSGSHLMSYVNAQQQAWPLEDLDFEIVNNLDGAREALAKEKAQVFLWEKFTTKPFVDNGEFRLAGICPTPYPCFTICVRNEILETNTKLIKKLVKKVQQYAADLSSNSQATDLIAKRYSLKKDDVEEWLELTEWASNRKVKKKTINKVLAMLQQLNLIDEDISYDMLVTKL